MSKGIANHRANACALEDDVRFKTDRCYCAGMVGGAERTHQLRFEARLGTVKDMHVQTPLLSEQGG
jgi:hypothetical protein